MIVVDASALLAVLLDEPDAPEMAMCITGAERCCVSVSSVFECSMKLQGLAGRAADGRLDVFLTEIGIEIVPIDLAQLAGARQAFGLYGKAMGHPARLNFGDCFSYALARSRNVPLLFKGHDFTHTDITPALN